MSASLVFRNTVIVIVTVVTAYVLFLSLNIVVVLLFAIILASAMRPAVLWLNKRGIPFAVSILLTYVLVIGVTIALFVIILPPAVTRLSAYLERPEGLSFRLIQANNWAERTLASITQATEPITLLEDDAIRTSVSSAVASLNRTIPSMAGNVGGLLGNMVLVFVIGVYWLVSRDAAVDFTLQLFSMARRPLVRQIILEIEQALGAYVRGMMLVVLFVGIANFILLTIFGVPNATTLAFVIGITTALPVIGGFIGAGVAVFLALLETPVAGLLTLVSFVLVQQVETNYLTPRMMSNSVHISPILVIVSLFIGFAVGGVVGGLVAVPVAGTLMVLARYLIIEPKKEQVAPIRTQGGILIAGEETRLDTPIPNEPGNPAGIIKP